MNRYGAFSTNDAAPDMPFGQQNRIQPAGQSAYHISSVFRPFQPAPSPPTQTTPGTAPGTGNGTPPRTPNPYTDTTISAQYCFSCSVWSQLSPIQKFGVVATQYPLPCQQSGLGQLFGFGIGADAITQWAGMVNNGVMAIEQLCGIRAQQAAQTQSGSR